MDSNYTPDQLQAMKFLAAAADALAQSMSALELDTGLAFVQHPDTGLWGVVDPHTVTPFGITYL